MWVPGAVCVCLLDAVVTVRHPELGFEEVEVRGSGRAVVTLLASAPATCKPPPCLGACVLVLHWRWR